MIPDYHTQTNGFLWIIINLLGLDSWCNYLWELDAASCPMRLYLEMYMVEHTYSKPWHNTPFFSSWNHTYIVSIPFDNHTRNKCYILIFTAGLVHKLHDWHNDRFYYIPLQKKVNIFALSCFFTSPMINA